MKILITGANGFIGKHLVEKLSQVHEVTGIDQDESEINGQKIYPLDLSDSEAVSDFFQDKNFDAIIHLAAKVPSSFTAPEAETSYEDNILMTQNILLVFDNCQAKKFIYASGISVLGEKVSGKVDEETPAQPDNFYTRAKFEGERLALKSVGANKKIFIFRIPAPYGPGLSVHAVISKFMQKASESEDITLFGTGGRSQDFIYIDDLTSAFEAGLESKYQGVYNIASGISISMKQLAKTVLQVFPNSKSKIVYSGSPDAQENYRIEVETKKAEKELNFKAKVNLIDGLRKMKEKQ